MKNITVDKYMRLLEPLSIEDKLELLSRLSESLKKNFFTVKSDKEKLLDKLAGAWEGNDEITAADIRAARTTSNREINLD